MARLVTLKEKHRMANLEGKLGTDPKPRETAGRSESSGNKHSEKRMANKQRKKRAHKRTLRRSNTNG
jgi:hypothetical protein